MKNKYFKLSAILAFAALALVATKHAHANSTILCFENTNGSISSYKSLTGSCAGQGSSSYSGGASQSVAVGNGGYINGESLYWQNVSSNTSLSNPTPLPTGLSASPTNNCGLAGQTVTLATINVNNSLAAGNYTIYFNGTSNPPGGNCQNSQLTANPASASLTIQVVDSTPECTLVVNTEYNGVIQPLPNGETYTYTIVSNNSSFGVQQITGPVNKQYNTNNASSVWNFNYVSASPAMQYLGLTPATPSSQTCPQNGGNITFTLIFTNITTSPGMVEFNTNTDSAVACGNIYIVISPSSGNNYWDVERDGTVIASSTTQQTLTDTPSGGVHTYTVRAFNQFGGYSAWTLGSPPFISPTPCGVNFSNSGKELYEVNGLPNPFTSNCIASVSGTSLPMRGNDTVTFRIDACNTGTISATNVTLVDTIDPNITNTRNFQLNGVAMQQGTNYTISGNQITFNLGTIAYGQQPYITFDATLLTPPGDGCSNATPSPKFCNSAVINYNSSVGPGTYAIPSIGPFIYSTASGGPNQIEIQP